MDAQQFEIDLGKRLQSLREEKGKTQAEVAKELGLKSRETIKQWESWERQIKARDLIKLAKYYGVSADYLLCVANVKDMDQSLQAIGRYTGLSEEAVEKLADGHTESPRMHRCLDKLLTSEDFDKLLDSLCEVEEAVKHAEFTMKNARDAQLDAGNVELALQIEKNHIEVAIWRTVKTINNICYELYPIKNTETKLLSAVKEAKDGKHQES